MKVQPKQILVALDYDSFNQAERICNLLNPDKFRIKVGKQLFSAEGPKILEKIHKLGFEIFLDLKIHDIPNTVYKSLLNIFNLNVWMTNIHLLGGQEMIQAAKQAQSESKSNSILVGVTILTSLNDDHLKEVGFQDGVKTIVSKLSSLAKEALLDGVVCSVEEVKNLKKEESLEKNLGKLESLEKNLENLNLENQIALVQRNQLLFRTMKEIL